MKHGILFLGLLLTAMAPSFAVAHCTMNEEIDLRKVHSNIFNDIKIRNQEQYGICYAHAASTLIDFHRKLKKTDRYQYVSTDPIGAAAYSTAIDGDGDVEGGEICTVINTMAAAGKGCGFSGIEMKKIKGFGNAVHLSLVQVFMPYILRNQNFVAVDPKLYPMAARKKNKKSLTKEQWDYLARMDVFMKFLDTELKMRDISKAVLPKIEDLFAQLQKLHAENRWANVEGEAEYLLIRSACEQNQYEMPKLTCGDYSNSQFDLVGLVDDQLRKNLPAGASICSKFLGNKKYKGLNGSNHKSDCGEHAVVIIGKRYQNGFCQYLIRNSWGSNAQYDWPSSSGDVWVDEFALKDNFFNVHVVK